MTRTAETENKHSNDQLLIKLRFPYAPLETEKRQTNILEYSNLKLDDQLQKEVKSKQDAS